MTDSIWDALDSDADPEVIKTVMEVEDRRRRDQWIREFLSEVPIQDLIRAVAVGVEQTRETTGRNEDSVTISKEEYEMLVKEKTRDSTPPESGESPTFSIEKASEEVEEEEPEPEPEPEEEAEAEEEAEEEAESEEPETPGAEADNSGVKA